MEATDGVLARIIYSSSLFKEKIILVLELLVEFQIATARVLLQLLLMLTAMNKLLPRHLYNMAIGAIAKDLDTS